MTISKSLRLTIAATALVIGTAANAAALTVYKSASCGCCGKWVEHVQKHGFTVKVVNVDDVRAVKTKAGIPDKLASCHTSLVGGYVVEGHVPAADIRKLLAQKPKAKGIAVAGMPMGAPGMEHGDHREPFQTVLIKADGSTATFARH
ncbi:MAG TPA: DUF411 domain-containing protein [Sphingomicrobium sp.]|nr:DUF411 domain-containing protein [Sphingomicrobium sp.]